LVDQAGTLLGHGVSQCTSTELLTFAKGVSVKTRGGLVG